MPHQRSNIEGFFGWFFVICAVLGIVMVVGVLWAMVELVNWVVAH